MSSQVRSEAFRPITNTPPTTVGGALKFYGRMLFDLQVLTVFRDLRRGLKGAHGSVLDVGCGQSPYRFLADRGSLEYVGIDIYEAGSFDYDNPGIIPFDGKTIPFTSEQFDYVICTEVLEHVREYQQLVDEIHRVLKTGGRALITVPWSARFHYIPYDYFRFTPSTLRLMFERFTATSLTPRGTDISVIGSKLIIVWARNILPQERWKLAFTPLWVLTSPLLLLIAAVAHISTLLNLGSSDDPLGYTVLATK